MRTAVIAVALWCTTTFQGYRVCAGPDSYASFEQRWQDWTVGDDNRGDRWIGQRDGRGGTIWDVKPGPSEGSSMTIDPFWTSVAALWGAVLSTGLAVLSIVPPRPRFHVEPGHDLTVRIVNPAKRMRFVRELWCFPFPGSEKPCPSTPTTPPAG